MSTSEKDIVYPTPIRSHNLISLYPALGITCADTISDYIALKEKQLHPRYLQDVAIKVTNCSQLTKAAIETSPCADIQKEFQSCLEAGQRRFAQCTKQYKEPLEMCTAKHVGPLDE